MFPSQFDSEFSRVRQRIKDAEGSYNFKTGGEVWANIGSNPLDQAFTELTELYLRADDQQRRRIYDSMAKDACLADLWYFVRRVGKQIHSQEDTKWLERGIAAALIDGARGDFRDLSVSLVLLRFAAELQGIAARPFFDRALQSADEKIAPILKAACDDKDPDVHFAVQTFGVPEWVAESVKRYGEHPTVIEMRKIQEAKMRNAQEGKKQMTAWLRNLIIFAIVFVLIVLWNYISSLIGK